MTKPEGWRHSAAQAGVAVTALPRALAWTAKALASLGRLGPYRLTLQPCLLVAPPWACRAVPPIFSLLCDPQMEKWHLKQIYSGGSRVRHENKALEWWHTNWSASEKRFIWFLSQTWSSHWAMWFGSACEGQWDGTGATLNGAEGESLLRSWNGPEAGMSVNTTGTQKAFADGSGEGKRLR